MEPKVSLTASQSGSDIDLNIQTKDINGLLELRIWQVDTRELLWEVNLNSYKDSRLTYGKLPINFRTFNGNLRSAQQLYPESGKMPSPFAPNEKFYIDVVAQYDASMAASGRAFYFLLSTDSNGHVSSIVSTARPKDEDFPNPAGNP